MSIYQAIKPNTTAKRLTLWSSKLRLRAVPDRARFHAISVEDMGIPSKTYEDGYLDGLMHSQTAIERLRDEFDHALRIGEQMMRAAQEDQQKNTTSGGDTMDTYQDGYLDGLMRSQAEIERLRGEFDHMIRVIEQTARVMQEDREKFKTQTVTIEEQVAEIDRIMRS